MVMHNLFYNSLHTKASGWMILIRLTLAMVFIPEGIQKLLFPAILGAGRFIAIGIPFPQLMGPFVGYIEIICGSLILFGIATRWATMPLIITMLVAIISTKIPILLGHDWWIFQVASFKRYGIWSMLHETRTDWAMLMCSLYLLVEGGGKWSIDNRINQH
jgi:putative oxidoreductase